MYVQYSSGVGDVHSINYVTEMFDLICESKFMTKIISGLERLHGEKSNNTTKHGEIFTVV